jgi:hypothetical protein
MPGCSVVKCRSQGKGLHTFPSDPDLRRQWILFCRRSPDWTPGRSARLCNDHFRPSDLKSWSGRVKDTAVPSIELCRSATETSAKRKKVGLGVCTVVTLCAAKAIFYCPSMNSHRPRSQNTAKERTLLSLL